MKGLPTRLVLLAFFASCLALTLLSQGLSWYRVHQGEQYVSRTLEAGFVKNEKTWRKHDNQLVQSTRVTTLDAKAYWELGEMHHLHAIDLRLWPARQRKEEKIAKRYYLLALTRSPDNGVLLARVSSRLASTDDRRAIDLLRDALKIAPYEPAAQYPMAESGMMLWDELDPGLKKAFKEMIRHAITVSEMNVPISELAREYGWSSVLKTL